MVMLFVLHEDARSSLRQQIIFYYIRSNLANNVARYMAIAYWIEIYYYQIIMIIIYVLQLYGGEP